LSRTFLIVVKAQKHLDHDYAESTSTKNPDRHRMQIIFVYVQHFCKIQQKSEKPIN